MQAVVEITRINLEVINNITQRVYDMIVVEDGECFFITGFQHYNSQVLRPGYMIDCMKELRKLTSTEYFEAIQIVKKAKEIKEQPKKQEAIERKVIPIRKDIPIKKDTILEQLTLF